MTDHQVNLLLFAAFFIASGFVKDKFYGISFAGFAVLYAFSAIFSR